MARPSKISLSEKQTIINNFFLFDCESDPERLKGRGVYTELAAFAVNNGYPNVKPYDFFRDEKAIEYINALYKNQVSEGENLTVVFQNFDIDYFLRKDISDDEKRKAFLELDAYYKGQLSVAKKRTKMYAAMQSEDNAIKEKNTDLKKQVSQLTEKCKVLETTIKDYEDYIRTNVTPKQAEEIINHKKDSKKIIENLSAQKPSTENDKPNYQEKLHRNLLVLK